ncbi:hypothetical protein JCM10207_007004 [Rhodosporidiobolus poonsookiae]
MTPTRKPVDPQQRTQRLYRTLHDQLDQQHFDNALRTLNKLLALDPTDALARHTRTQVLVALDRFADALAVETIDEAHATDRAYCLYKLGRASEAADMLDCADEDDGGDRAREVLRAQLHYRLGAYEAARDAYDDLIASADPDAPDLADLESNLATASSHVAFLAAVPSALSSLSQPSTDVLESRPLAAVLPPVSRAPAPVASTSTAPAPEPPKRRNRRPLPPRAQANSAAPPPAEDRWIPKRQRPSMRDALLQAKERARGRRREKVAGMAGMQGAVEEKGEKGGTGTPKKQLQGGGGGKKKKGKK